MGTMKRLIQAWASIDTGKGIIIAAAIFGACYVGGNLYKVTMISEYQYIVVNSLTGSIKDCRSANANC